jgi:hypothetical protein
VGEPLGDLLKSVLIIFGRGGLWRKKSDVSLQSDSDIATRGDIWRKIMRNRR